jgi:hypothetical protein
VTEIKLRDAKMILKTKKTTTVEKNLVATQQNTCDVVPELCRATFMGNTSKTEKLLTASGTQSYIN